MANFNFTSFSYPNARTTYGFGVNASGEFVGTEVDAGGTGHGYVDNGGSVTLLNIPGATAVELDGVNASGQLSGSYKDGAGAVHGFTSARPNNQVTTINYPGATQTFGRGINTTGATAGTYDDSAGKEHAYVFSGNAFTSFDYPGATITDGVAINDAGTLVGDYQRSDNTVHGFVENAGTFTSIDFPGAATTYVNGLNNKGQIVGTYALANGAQHAFLFDGAKTYTSFDYPGTTSGTSANGINDAGEIVGDYTNAAGAMAVFTATPACYVSGTAIRTTRGDVPVESLRIGDSVVTASGAVRAIRWLGRRSYIGRFANANPDVLPVCFAAGSLAEGLPLRDLWVSPKHAMFLDGVLVPAECLVNDVTVTRARRIVRVDYHHVELDSHDILLAEGTPSESFVDDDSRGVFNNAHEYSALFPDAVAPEAVFCAPRIEHGYELEAIRRRIAARASRLTAAG